MASLPKENVTQLLKAWSNGDQSAWDELLSTVYQDLKKRARVHMWRERPNHTLQPTALINEAYIRIADQSSIPWQNRAHFFKVVSKIMRQILIDYARERAATKRGKGQDKLVLDEAIAEGQERDIDLIVLDEALAKYEKIDQRRSELIELRYFGGFSHEEVAELMHISETKVKRDLRTALAWMRREIS